QARDLGLHQRLGQHPNPFPEHVPVLLLEQLADERGKIHPPLGHRRPPLPCLCLAVENTRGRCAMAVPFSTGRRPRRFPPRPGTLPMTSGAPAIDRHGLSWAMRISFPIDRCHVSNTDVNVSAVHTWWG